jgi:hypothetical protein
MVNNEELIGTTEYLALYMKCRMNRCRYNRVRPCIYTYETFHCVTCWKIITVVDTPFETKNLTTNKFLQRRFES